MMRRQGVDLRSSCTVQFQSSSLDVRPCLQGQADRGGESSLPRGDEAVGDEVVLSKSGITDLESAQLPYEHDDSQKQQLVRRTSPRKNRKKNEAMNQRDTHLLHRSAIYRQGSTQPVPIAQLGRTGFGGPRDSMRKGLGLMSGLRSRVRNRDWEVGVLTISLICISESTQLQNHTDLQVLVGKGGPGGCGVRAELAD